MLRIVNSSISRCVVSLWHTPTTSTGSSHRYRWTVINNIIQVAVIGTGEQSRCYTWTQSSHTGRHSECYLLISVSLSATGQSFSSFTCMTLQVDTGRHSESYLLISASLSATRQSFSSFTSRYSTRPSRRKSSKLLDTDIRQCKMYDTVWHLTVIMAHLLRQQQDIM